MAWKRINKNLYFYRSKREGGRVVSEYLGCGEVANLIAQLDKLTRGQREANRGREKAAIEEMEREEKAIKEWFESIEVIATGAMLAAGFHKHHGQWRRTRHGEGKEKRSTQTSGDGRAEAAGEDDLEGIP